MKKRALLVLPALLFAAAVIVGCGSTPKGNGSGGNTVTLKQKDISFKSEPGVLAMTNNTTQDVVVFVGQIRRDVILGGIKSGERRTFDLSKIPGLPSNGSLLVRVATYNAYRGKSKITDTDIIYTGLVVYDLKDAKAITELTIYRDIDAEQKYCVYFTNTSENFVVEVRLEKPNGEAIATLAPLESDKCVYLAPKGTGKGYKFFPQFVYVDPRTNEKTVLNVPDKANVQVMDPDPVGGDFTPVVFDSPKNHNVSYSLAFLTIRNDTKAGMEFRNSRTSLPNQRGRRFTAPGRSDVYELDTGLDKAGRMYTALTCAFNEYTEMSIGGYTFKPGYMYEMICKDADGGYHYDIREVGQKSLLEDARIELFMEN